MGAMPLYKVTVCHYLLNLSQICFYLLYFGNCCVSDHHGLDGGGHQFSLNP